MTAGKQPRIKLIAIDDDPQSLELIKEALEEKNLDIQTATDAEQGLELVLNSHPQIVLLDLVMPKMGGMELLERIQEAAPDTDIVLVTAHYSTESAIEAIQKGASDYINKPISINLLRQRVSKFVEAAQRRQRVLDLDGKIVKAAQFEGMVGRSPVMLQMFTFIQRVAPHFKTVLITGETGSGKELVARALHKLSPSATSRFVACNCSAIAENLFESELFGHVKGAFTGATQDRPGFLEYASGGTLFLDEIGDMPISAQSKLLRAIERKEFQRVGSPTVRSADFRVIAATNRILRKMIGETLFRDDLFYRLSMIEIKVPRLADRKEDLTLLEHHFLEKFSLQYGKSIRGITPRAQIALARHSWPGNVRELENVLGHACMIAQKEMVDIRDIPEYLWVREHQESIWQQDELLPMAEIHRRYARHVLKRTDGNKAQTARILGINRATLYRLLDEDKEYPEEK